NELRDKSSQIKGLNIIVHHTLVYCYSDQLATNSPEGIHQDGMDYIVSALVMERHNIAGGRSVIYGNDMQTKVMETTLQSGQGILQPDLGTELWHEVTAIRCKNAQKLGYRSTIGYDITVIDPE
ncbi:MAG: 2OG-Fe dioxygenase family protein, partial [Bacteroidota bacterium]